MRSLELDTKEWSPPLVALMCSLGNERLNAFWQPSSEVGAGQRPTADAGAAQREAFIRRKYESKGFLKTSARPAAAALHLAALTDDTVLAASCLAHGLEIDEHAPSAPGGLWTAEAAAAHAGRTALQVAAAACSEAVLELLLQNLARSAGGVDYVGEDVRGQSALHLAVDAGHAGIVEQLITRGANISSADHAQQTPMQAASDGGREDLVKVMLDYKLAEDEKRLAQDMAQFIE